MPFNAFQRRAHYIDLARKNGLIINPFNRNASFSITMPDQSVKKIDGVSNFIDFVKTYVQAAQQPKTSAPDTTANNC